ncbi:hypothetical protein GGI04_004316 [Coemansia thaxteri]|nr:hypothetical protein GGI04_004316 [Coemansia thaxteri]
MNLKAVCLVSLSAVALAQNNHQNLLDDIVNDVGNGFNGLTSLAVNLASQITDGAVGAFSHVTEGAVSVASRASSDFEAGKTHSSTTSAPTSSGESASAPTSTTSDHSSSNTSGATNQAPYAGMAAFVAFLAVSQLI